MDVEVVDGAVVVKQAALLRTARLLMRGEVFVPRSGVEQMNIALIGLGEVGRVLAEDLADGNVLSAWDIAFDDPGSRAARNAGELPVRVATDALDAVQSAGLVISAVTAANDLSAARDVAAASQRERGFST